MRSERDDFLGELLRRGPAPRASSSRVRAARDRHEAWLERRRCGGWHTGLPGWVRLLIFITALLCFLATLPGCVGTPDDGTALRPWFDLHPMAHDGLGQNSFAAGGVSILTKEGARLDVGPAFRFDLGGDGHAFNDSVAGAVFRLEFVR